MDNGILSDEKSTFNRFNSLFWRLFLSIVCLTVLPLLVVITSEYQNGRANLLENLHYQLEVINEQLIEELGHYLTGIETGMDMEAPDVAQMLLHLDQSQQAHQQEDTLFTQSFSYELIVSQYKDNLSRYIQTYHLPGIIIADTRGDTLYADGIATYLLGQNLFSGFLSATELSSIAKNTLKDGHTRLTHPERLTDKEDSPHSRLVYSVGSGESFSGVIIASLDSEHFAELFHYQEKHLGVKAFLLSDDGFVQYGTDVTSDQQMTLKSNNPKAAEASYGDDHHSGLDVVAEYFDHLNRLVFGDIHSVQLPGMPAKVVVEIKLSEALRPVTEFRNRLLFLMITTLLIVLIIAYFITLHIIRPVQKLTHRVLKVKGGDYENREVIRSYNEITLLSQNFEHMVKETGKLFDQTRLQNWHQQGLVQLHSMISGNIDTHQLAENTLTFIARYMDFKAGAFYVLDDSRKYRLRGTYARPKGLSEVFAPGEGLVGQAAIDKEILNFKQDDDMNLLIESATGSARPGTITAIPVIFENSCIGVIAVARFEPMNQQQEGLLTEAITIIAMALHSAQQREALQQPNE